MIESTGEMMKKIEIVYRDEQNEAVIRELNHVVEDIFYGYAEVATRTGLRMPPDFVRMCIWLLTGNYCRSCVTTRMNSKMW